MSDSSDSKRPLLAANDLAKTSVQHQGRTAYLAKKGGKLTGAVFETSGKGYSGSINVVMAVDPQGKVLGVRDKGPLFLIYPFDQRPETRSDQFYGRSIWQITRVTVQ